MFVCPECGDSYPQPGACAKDGAVLADGTGDPLLGQFVGSYRVACMIGAGGMGQVYKGVHPSIGSRVAIKVVGGDWARQSQLVERFFSEARAVNVIRHENIVNVLDLAWLPDGRPYIVMEFLDGQPLSSVIRNRGPLPLGSLTSLLSEVLDALGAAHDHGIVHRDLKPDNIFVTPGGRAKVLDFGIAKLRPELSAMHGATETGSILGTPHYMSPEQALGRPVDARADIYSLGVILFEGATGRLPFTGTVLFDLLKAHIETPPPHPRTIRPDLPEPLALIVLRALEKDPSRRFGNAGEFAAALAGVAQGLPRESFGSLGGRTTGASGLQTPGFLAATPPVTGGSLAGAATPYTSPGLSAPATKRGRGGTFIVIAVAVGGLLVAGGIVALGVVLFAFGWAATASDEPSAKRDDASSHSGTGDREGGTSPRQQQGPVRWNLQKPDGWDPAHIDVAERFRQGEGFAKQTYPDAELIALIAYGVNRDGIINLNIEGESGSQLMIRWRSPEQSRRPDDLPQGAKVKAECTYQYMVMEMGITAMPAGHMGCEEQTVVNPRCSVQQVWTKAEAAGAPRGNVIGNVHYGIGGKPRWYVEIGDYSGYIEDDC